MAVTAQGIRSPRLQRAFERHKRQSRGEAFQCQVVTVSGSFRAGNGLIWVRKLDESGSTTGAPFKIRQKAGASIILGVGRVMNAKIGVQGVHEIESNSWQDLADASIPIAQMNFMEPRNKYNLIANLTALQAFPQRTPDETVWVQGSPYKKPDGDYDIYSNNNAGSLRSYDLITDYIPASADDQVVVCLWLDTYNNTISATSSSAVSQDTNLKTSVTDQVTYINQAAVKRPADSIGVWAFIVGGDDTVIDVTNKLQDLRGILSAENHYGFPTTISRNIRIWENHQVIVKGNVTIDSSRDLVIESGGNLIIQ